MLIINYFPFYIEIVDIAKTDQHLSKGFDIEINKITLEMIECCFKLVKHGYAQRALPPLRPVTPPCRPRTNHPLSLLLFDLRKKHDPISFFLLK